jgi:hypothetical protein
MAKKSFKVGEKVVPRHPECWAQGNNIGTVVSTESTPWIIVEWKWNGTPQKSAYYPEEIKYVPQKNQQLLFSFMNED